jgi:hypothetical protein
MLPVLPQQIERFEENLFPRDRRNGEKYPGEVIERLVIAGCPPEEVFFCLFAYATGSDSIRMLQRESIRYHRERMRLDLERALATVKYWKFKFRFHAGNVDTKEVKEAEWVEQIISEVAPHFRRSRDIGRKLRRFGVSRLEYLAILQCFAEEVGIPLTEDELSELVWAAVSAVYPKAKRIETDTLAQAMRRFHKRTPGLKDLIKEGVSITLHRYRTAPPSPLR